MLSLSEITLVLRVLTIIFLGLQLTIILLQLLDTVLINGFDHVKDLVSVLADSLNKGRVLYGVLGKVVMCNLYLVDERRGCQ